MISGRELFAEISNEAISEDGEAVGYFVKNSRMELLERLLTAQPAPANAQIAGYFVRHRSVWDKEIMWKPWTECSGEDYAEYCKRIATGEADAGRFYEARILYDAQPAPESTNAADWGINMQTGTPILVYKNCSVIESEQAYFVLSLINSAAAPAVPEEMKRDPDADVFDPGFMNGWNACRAAMLAAAPKGGN